MGMKIRSNTNPRQTIRLLKKSRIRKKIDRQKGLVARLVVYRSNQYLYAQIVDDLKGNTLAQANTNEKALGTLASKKNLAAAEALGKLVAERAIEKNVQKVVFDRNGYNYHGRVKALADAARKAGLNF
jgi:large subunit ribosomal protein L18